jgi:hypothetical protein
MASFRQNWLRSRRAWAAALLVCLAGVGIWFAVEQWWPLPNHVEPDSPWKIEFGRGSGWRGLNTVCLTHDGVAVLHRMNHASRSTRDPYWETTSLTLPPEAVAEVVASVEKNRLLGLQHTYRSGAHDGTQWVFRFTQGGYEKAVYFDNEFPRAIERFSADLHRVLAEHGLRSREWSRVPDGSWRRHERALWDSIRRKRGRP